MIAVKMIRRHGFHRYAIASAINTLLGIAIITALYTVTHSPSQTLIISSLFGYLYSLATYHRIAFLCAQRRPPFLRYAIVYGSALGLNALITWLMMTLTGSFLMSQLVAIPTVVSLQWAASRFWAFRSRA